MSWTPTESADGRRPAVRSPLVRHGLGPVGGMGAPGSSALDGSIVSEAPAGLGRRRVAAATAYAVSQLLLIAVLYGAYSVSRHLAKGREHEALHHATDVWRLERFLHLPSEATVQRLAMHATALVEAADWYYILVHFPSVIILLLWVFIRQRRHWARVRNALIMTTGLALIIHLSYPLAPPRFLPDVMHLNLVDTGKAIGPSPYGEGSDGLANEYAAMPSLHVGWSLLEAWAVITILRHRVRWLMVLHPVLTTTVVVVTANHFWLDGMVGAALVMISVVLLDQAYRAWNARGVGRHETPVRTPAPLPAPISVPAPTPTPARAASVPGPRPQPGFGLVERVTLDLPEQASGAADRQSRPAAGPPPGHGGPDKPLST